MIGVMRSWVHFLMSMSAPKGPWPNTGMSYEMVNILWPVIKLMMTHPSRTRTHTHPEQALVAVG